jgi:hypothetical protein
MSSSTITNPSQACRVPRSVTAYVLGKTLDEAEIHVLNAGFRFRVLGASPATRDHRDDRVGVRLDAAGEVAFVTVG